jgi:CRP-like cAMP-binding protein
LEYLTPNDWSLLVDKATLASFKPGECLVRQGEKTNAVYILVNGAATIQVYATKIAQIGSGEICGEMAFLEQSAPSATVTAEKALQALLIEWEALADLFELFPHLASRFYRSVAVNLSRRLRNQIVLKQGGKK